MRKTLGRVQKEQDGATALEYAILVVLVAIVFAAGALFFGQSLSNLFSKSGTEVNAVSPSSIATP